MAAWTSGPQRNAVLASDLHDRTVWMLLRGLVACRPALPAPRGGADPDPQQRLTHPQISATVGDIRAFADKVGELLTLPDAPDGAGTARAVTTVVVRLCREFAARWAGAGPATSHQTTEFLGDVDVLETALDAIATRPRN